jgi:hypothetical protein
MRPDDSLGSAELQIMISIVNRSCPDLHVDYLPRRTHCLFKLTLPRPAAHHVVGL